VTSDFKLADPLWVEVARDSGEPHQIRFGDRAGQLSASGRAIVPFQKIGQAA
jgi:hypothetical protein